MSKSSAFENLGFILELSLFILGGYIMSISILFGATIVALGFIVALLVGNKIYLRGVQDGISKS